jgi:N-acetylmuramoyl-L-alanine amidase
MASTFLYLLDPGHGGLDPKTGQYVTPGKRSPKFDDGTVLYEGVNNRDNVKRLKKALTDAGIDAVDLVDTHTDVSLGQRVQRANELSRKRKCVFISMHSDGFGSGSTWESPSGISVFTAKGQTKSDDFASLVIQELVDKFGDSVKWRFDTTDGDKDKEAHFYVLHGTSCPAILIEGGFHTNKVEAARMLTNEWKDKLISGIVEAIQLWETKHEKG